MIITGAHPATDHLRNTAMVLCKSSFSSSRSYAELMAPRVMARVGWEDKGQNAAGQLGMVEMQLSKGTFARMWPPGASTVV